MRNSPSLKDLTPAELTVLRWIAAGKSVWETSRILGCATETVKKHRYRIYRALGVENAVLAANFCRESVADNPDFS